MPRSMNYADNIFFLKLRLKTLEDCLKLELDPALYARAVHEEILFIHSAAGQLYARIQESSLVVSRLENIKSIHRVILDLSRLLAAVLEQKMAFSSALSEYEADYHRISDELRASGEQTKGYLTGVNDKALENRYIISEDEYKHLFADEE